MPNSRKQYQIMFNYETSIEQSYFVRYWKGLTCGFLLPTLQTQWRRILIKCWDHKVLVETLFLSFNKHWDDPLWEPNFTESLRLIFTFWQRVKDSHYFIFWILLMCDTSDLGYEALLYQAYQPFSVKKHPC